MDLFKATRSFPHTQKSKLRMGGKNTIFRAGADEKQEVRKQLFPPIGGPGIAALFCRKKLVHA
jgi:hypothetical protein